MPRPSSVQRPTGKVPRKKICRICRNLNPSLRFKFRDDWIDVPGEDVTFQRKLVDFYDSSGSSCRFCSILLQSIRHFSGDISESRSYTIHLSRGATYVHLLGDLPSIQIYSPRGASVAWRHLRILRDINTDLASDESFAFVKNSLASCCEGHDLCKQASQFLPKRILDIGFSPDIIKLVETETNSVAPYVALSYCWGTTQFLTTTTLSIEERKIGIKMSSLPKTFIDAIVLTRRLGVRYIWIDSLCIIQNSTEDWEVESAKMATVYEQAYLTIAASSSPSCDKPFLVERDNHLPALATIPCLDDNGHSTIVRAMPLPRTGIHDWLGDARDPWDMRSWTLQEKLLSTRLISYSGDEMQWHCKTLSNCECERGPLNEWLTCPTSIFQLHEDRDAYMFWQVQVMEYTKRWTTYPHDKLPAISGVASVIQQVTNSEYFAGLWVENFMLDLCWERVGEGPRKKWEPSWGFPSLYRAPSFSWASVEGEVYYSEEHFYGDWVWHASALERSLTLSGNNSFGQVKGASVKIRGPILKASLNSMPDGSEQPFSYSLYLDATAKEETLTADVMLEEYTFDTISGSPRRSVRRSTKEVKQLFENVPVCILSLGYDTESKGTGEQMRCWHKGLVLGVSPIEPTAYERLGLASFYELNAWEWKKSLEEEGHETITLI